MSSLSNAWNGGQLLVEDLAYQRHSLAFGLNCHVSVVVSYVKPPGEGWSLPYLMMFI